MYTSLSTVGVICLVYMTSHPMMVDFVAAPFGIVAQCATSLVCL